MTEATNTEATVQTEAVTENAGKTVGEAVRNAVGHVPAGYESKLDAAVTAAEDATEQVITELGYDLWEKLYEAAAERGYGSQARTILEAAGLSERPAPEPEPVVEEESTPEVDDADKSDRELLEELVGSVRGLATTVNDQGRAIANLESAARRNGIHIG